jgi:hypothetical protein
MDFLGKFWEIELLSIKLKNNRKNIGGGDGRHNWAASEARTQRGRDGGCEYG